MKRVLVSLFLVSLLAQASMPTVNYDDQFDNAEIENIDEHIVTDALSGLRLESLTFKEEAVIVPQGQGFIKNVPVKKVQHGEKVVYLNRLFNESGETKYNIVVKNPIPEGTRYLTGSATCDEGCKIRYSNNLGVSVENHEDRNERYNYIEFHFYKIPADTEMRMGFRTIVE